MSEFLLDGKPLGPLSPPYVIAEIGVNHEGDLELAKRLVDLAQAGGADAVKFQSYKAGSLASRHSPAYWDLKSEPTTSQFALFKKYDRFGPAEYQALAAHCQGRGITFLSTPFDEEAVDFLDPWMPLFKIASADITCVPLLERIAAKRKPVLLSTGAATAAEVEDALAILHGHGAPSVHLLHCVLNYPTQDINAGLGQIKALARLFPGRLIGYSDHTLPEANMDALTFAYILGARIIEKHFTHDKTLPGNDHYHAMDADDLRRFRERVERHRLLAGDELKHYLPSEEPARAFARRSIVARQAIAAGEVITARVVTCKRPGTGIPAAHWHAVLGKKALRDIEEDQVLAWGDLAPAGD
ncbi:MAG: N-acetylneuraminate synthase family protein [Pseudomonadota bacterium]